MDQRLLLSRVLFRTGDVLIAIAEALLDFEMQASIAKASLTIDPDAKFARVVDSKDRRVCAVASQDLRNRISQTAQPELEHRRRDNIYLFNSRFGHANPPLARLLGSSQVE